MGREILFRGKRTDGKGWVEGLPVYLTEYAKDFNEIDGIQCNKTRENYDVDPETVGQFTNLISKNNIKIFDGDILNWDYCGTTEYSEWMKDPVYKVIYKHGHFVCAIGINKDLFCHSFRFKYCEVIGNIHDDGPI